MTELTILRHALRVAAPTERVWVLTTMQLKGATLRTWHVADAETRPLCGMYMAKCSGMSPAKVQDEPPDPKQSCSMCLRLAERRRQDGRPQRGWGEQPSRT